MPSDEKLYFAYGSNMGASSLRERCLRAEPVGIARVDGYRLGFTRYSARRGGGVADLVKAEGSVVWGVLFDLSYDDFAALDRAEGVPHAYNREVREFVAPDGSPISAWVYLVAKKEPELLPSRTYWRLLVEGAKEAGLPPDYVRTLEAITYAS